jgi:hypothetical protein
MATNRIIQQMDVSILPARSNRSELRVTSTHFLCWRIVRARVVLIYGKRASNFTQGHRNNFLVIDSFEKCVRVKDGLSPKSSMLTFCVFVNYEEMMKEINK